MLDTEYFYYLADTDEGKSIHFQLRYNVYCLRERYEDPKLFPDREEKDRHDGSSAHFLVRSRSTGDWVGAMRLVIGRATELPMSRVAPIPTEYFAAVGREKVAEASRLCAMLPQVCRLGPASRPRPWTHPSGQTIRGHRILHQASAMTIGLIRAARAYSLAQGIIHCHFLINDPLARILRNLGMTIEPVGDLCEHRGWRRPYRHNFKTGYTEMARRSPELYESFCTPIAYEHYSETSQSAEEILAISA